MADQIGRLVEILTGRSAENNIRDVSMDGQSKIYRESVEVLIFLTNSIASVSRAKVGTHYVRQ